MTAGRPLDGQQRPERRPEAAQVGLQGRQPGGDSIIAANLKLVNAGDRYILYGPITQGKFQIGVGNLTFTVGDMYFLTVFKNGVDASLQLVNATDVWSTHLTWF